MKNLKLLSLFALALIMTGLWSCNPDEGNTNDVTLAVTPDNEFPAVGDTVNLTVAGSATLENLTNIVVTIVSTDSTGTAFTLPTSLDTSVSTMDFVSELRFVVPEKIGSGTNIVIEMSATDELDGAYSASAEVTVATYMAIYRDSAVVGHRWGPLNGAFNLVTGIEAFQDAPNNTKDLIDNSEQEKELAGAFRAHEETNTSYVDLGKEFDISTIHTSNVSNIYNNRSSSTLITVTSGTKFLARLRGGSSWAVVHIQAVEPDFESQPTNNAGRYIFDLYRMN